MSNDHDHLSNSKTIVALVNGMIGGIILVMPILSLKVGYLMIAPVVLVTGFFSYFSCLLCVRHLREYKDLDEAILKHFENRRGFKMSYDICIAVSIIVVLILYFDLICIQWSGLTTGSKLIPILNAVTLFPVVYVMKKYHFGASLLAYGIISAIGYCCFLLYMWIQAPEGTNTLSPADRRFPELAAALSQGFAIQMFFIPVLKKNPNRHLYKKLLGITYIIGGLAYAFIGYAGSLSIINRTYPGTRPQTIVEYFDKGAWQVILVQIIYLVHLYSAFPEFLLISKKRVFSVMQWPQPSGVSLKQVIYVSGVILICLVIKLTNISAEVIIQLNGSILSFIFITIIPVALHVKCLYFSSKQNRHQNWQDEKQNEKKYQPQNKGYNYIDRRQSPRVEEKKKQEINMEVQDSNQNQKQVNNKEQYIYTNTKSSGSDEVLPQQPMQPQISVCCDVEYKSKTQEYCELFLMFAMVVSGLATMVYTVYTIFNDNDNESTL